MRAIGSLSSFINQLLFFSEHQPLPVLLTAFSSYRIATAKKRTPDAPGNTMEVRCVLKRSEDYQGIYA